MAGMIDWFSLAVHFGHDPSRWTRNAWHCFFHSWNLSLFSGKCSSEERIGSTCAKITDRNSDQSVPSAEFLRWILSFNRSQ